MSKVGISLRKKGIFNRLCRFVLVFCTFRFRVNWVYMVSWGLNLSNILNVCVRPTTVQLVTHTARIGRGGVTTINKTVKNKHNTIWWTNNKRLGLGQTIPPPKNTAAYFLNFYLTCSDMLFIAVCICWSLLCDCCFSVLCGLLDWLSQSLSSLLGSGLDWESD